VLRMCLRVAEEAEEAEEVGAELVPAGSVMVTQREPPTAWSKVRARVMSSAKRTLMDYARAMVSERDLR
jgi:hypothetical protein